MKKILFIPVLALLIMPVLSCKMTTNYTLEGYKGKIVVNNKSSRTITRIVIESHFFSGNESAETTFYDETVSVARGNSSGRYELSLSCYPDSKLVQHNYRVTVTGGGATRSIVVVCYEDIVNQVDFYDNWITERK